MRLCDLMMYCDVVQAKKSLGQLLQVGSTAMHKWPAEGKLLLCEAGKAVRFLQAKRNVPVCQSRLSNVSPADQQTLTQSQ